MKKLRRAVLLGMMICSLTACGKDENNTRDKRISEPYTVVDGVTIVFGTEYVTTEETTMSPDTEPEIDDETKQTADSTPNDTKSDTVASSPASTAPLLEFNGNADEIVTADKDSYYLGGKYVLYVEAGAKLPGNTPENLDRIMSELEELYKLSFKKTSYIEKEPWLNEYFGNTFNGINTDLDKIYNSGADPATIHAKVAAYYKGLRRVLKKQGKTSTQLDAFDKAFAEYTQQKNQ